jgi:hypothetical protein
MGHASILNFENERVTAEFKKMEVMYRLHFLHTLKAMLTGCVITR